MTQLEFARLNSNLYKSLNEYCRLMPCIRCPFYASEGTCVFEQCRETLQPLVFEKTKMAVPAKTNDRLTDLENRVGRLEELVEELQKKD